MRHLGSRALLLVFVTVDSSRYQPSPFPHCAVVHRPLHLHAGHSSLSNEPAGPFPLIVHRSEGTSWSTPPSPPGTTVHTGLGLGLEFEIR